VSRGQIKRTAGDYLRNDHVLACVYLQTALARVPNMSFKFGGPLALSKDAFVQDSSQVLCREFKVRVRLKRGLSLLIAGTGMLCHA
jgi:hypothetical protein